MKFDTTNEKQIGGISVLDSHSNTARLKMFKADDLLARDMPKDQAKATGSDKRV